MAAPRKYNGLEHDIEVRALTRLGLPIEEIARVMGINTNTFHEWLRKYPSFDEHHQAGLETGASKIIDAQWALATGLKEITETHEIFDAKGRLINKKVITKTPEASLKASIWIMRNRFPHLWNKSLNETPSQVDDAVECTMSDTELKHRLGALLNRGPKPVEQS